MRRRAYRGSVAVTTSPKSRLVWITGAGKGIGRALTLKLVRDGWTVAASARTEADLMTLAQDAGSLQGRVMPYPLDITDSDAVQATHAAIESELGEIDLAVLNAGTHQPTPIDDFSAEAFQKLMNVNVMGTVNCLEALLAQMRPRRRGRIAIVASVAGYRGLPTAAAYGASKAALINMAEALKPELDGIGIDLKLINPGFVKTPLTDRNTFPMPFLISAEEAADCIHRGLQSRAFEIAFPFRFALIMKLLRILPDRLFFAVTRRMVTES